MAQRNNTYKTPTVKEHAVQSVKEAGLYDLTLKDGARAVFVANTGFPHHDTNLHKVVLQHIADVQPKVVFLLGGMADSGAFVALIDNERNFLHTYGHAAPVTAARKHVMFEDRVRSLGASFGEFIREYADACPTANVVYVPSWVNLGLPNELDILDWCHAKKKYLDSWTSNHPDAVDAPSNPFDTLPTSLTELLGLEGEKRIQILPFGAAVLVNDKTLVLGGSFRRRHAGDSPWIEWEQRGYSVIKAVDGKSGSGWANSIRTTVPEPVYDAVQVHEIGYGWNAKEFGHLGDYHRRAQSILSGSFYFGEFFGDVVPFFPGKDGRRTLYVQGRSYTEEAAGGGPNRGTVTLVEVDETPAQEKSEG
jgi:hypothetical protein